MSASDPHTSPVSTDAPSLAALSATEVERASCQAIVALSAGLAHELTNLLILIQGHTEQALLDLSDPASTAESLEFVRSSAQVATELCGRLLAVARPVSASQERVDLVALIRGAMRFVRPALGGRVAVEETYPSARLFVRMDPNKLVLALTNLVLNARDAMGGQGRVRLRVQADSPGGPACVEVRDNGPGIEAAMLPRLFHPRSTSKPGGRGLGLFMTRTFLEEAGASIEVESFPGQGTLFRILFGHAEMEPLDAPREKA